MTDPTPEELERAFSAAPPHGRVCQSCSDAVVSDDQYICSRCWAHLNSTPQAVKAIRAYQDAVLRDGASLRRSALSREEVARRAAVAAVEARRSAVEARRSAAERGEEAAEWRAAYESASRQLSDLELAQPEPVAPVAVVTSYEVSTVKLLLAAGVGFLIGYVVSRLVRS